MRSTLLLEEGAMEVTHRLIDASNATLLAEIEGFGKVIYKPIAGERPLWDFPDGTLADREVATFKLSKHLGLDFIPPTVMRDGPYGPGMVQEWIEINAEADLISFAQGRDEQIRGLVLFDAIVNNTDRKFGHLLLTKNEKLFGCDHGVTFHHEDKLRTVLWQFAGEEFNRKEIALLGRFTLEENEVRNLLREHLTQNEIEAIFGRVKRLQESKVFPSPSDTWPSVPWPPV